ncbi:MAG: hypothetical protein ABI183_08630 [Polyangiaceae bacterium]
MANLDGIGLLAKLRDRIVPASSIKVAKDCVGLSEAVLRCKKSFQNRRNYVAYAAVGEYALTTKTCPKST